MAVPAQYASRFVYHFSHINNLPKLIRKGFLATNHPDFPKSHHSIAASSIQQRRAQMQVPCGSGGCVHDYVPLYFGSLSPMLLSVLHKKNIDQCDILYFEFPIELVNDPNTVFTGASANTTHPPKFYSDPADLSQLDWEAIDSLKWSNPDDDFRHRRMAELLVLQQLPVTAATRCIVWNQTMKERIEQIIDGAPFPPIAFENKYRRHFYTNLELKDNSSLIKGPKDIADEYNEAYKRIDNHIKTNTTVNQVQFKNLYGLLEELQNNFGCTPHTAELVGLKSANGVHRHTVDIHTKNVVQCLLALPEYAALNEKSKTLTEIAAFLHDIGKGPRSRWASNGGVQKIDPNHPVGAMPMIEEILTKYVQKFKLSSAKTLMKLVCYHDLVGDVLGRERDEKQIVDVVDSKAELDMLFAIGKADVTSLNDMWWEQSKANQLYASCLMAIEKKANSLDD